MSSILELVIIGGSDAGISAALRARELDPTAHVTVLLDDEFPNYSICGLPFYLSGETSDWQSLAHRTEFAGIDICRRHKVTRIDAAKRTVEVHTSQGPVSLCYDKLVIGTGARPSIPRIDGWQRPGVFLLHTMNDSFALRDFIAENSPRRCIIIGAGYIGLEMADALTHRGIEVTIASRTASVLATVDASLGGVIEQELQAHGVSVRNNVEANGIASTNGRLHVSGSNAFAEDCDMVLIAVGVTPNSELGVAAGIKTGQRGALSTNRKMESNLPDIYIAGDCAETWHHQLGRFVYMPLGTTAHKQGRVAGENAVGGQRQFAGTLGTQVVKVFGLVIGRTGLREDEAKQEGFEPLTIESTVNDHKAYYPGATQLRISIVGDRHTGRFLGAQVIGSYGAEISKRLDVFAAAIFHEMMVDDINDLDLSYTPPLGSPWDAVQMASQVWSGSRRQHVQSNLRLHP